MDDEAAVHRDFGSAAHRRRCAKTPAVIPRTPFPDRLGRLAARQAHTLSRAQVIAAGISDPVIARWVRDDRLTPLARGVYATGAGGWQQLVWAGVLLGGPDAVVGAAAAAHLYGLVREPRRITVYTGDRQVVRDPRWRFRRAFRVGVGHPSRTTPADTIVDLAGELPVDGVAALVAAAVGNRVVHPDLVLDALARVERHPSRRLLTEILGEVAQGSRSPLEVRYARDVERAHRLPAAERQAGPCDRQTDAWYRRYRLIVELDGRAYHEGVAAWNDLQRDNLHRLHEVVTLRYAWVHVATQPCRVAAEVAAALRLGGWPGGLTRCRRCPAGRV